MLNNPMIMPFMKMWTFLGASLAVLLGDEVALVLLSWRSRRRKENVRRNNPACGEVVCPPVAVALSPASAVDNTHILHLSMLIVFLLHVYIHTYIHM